jgi:hypothetical protein
MARTPREQRDANAVRQAQYRRKHLRPGVSLVDLRARINLVVQPGTAYGLKRLARHWGVSQVEALARIVDDAEGRAIKPLKHDALRDYYGDSDVTA